MYQHLISFCAPHAKYLQWSEKGPNFEQRMPNVPTLFDLMIIYLTEYFQPLSILPAIPKHSVCSKPVRSFAQLVEIILIGS
jgi:hypothetical protein